MHPIARMLDEGARRPLVTDVVDVAQQRGLLAVAVYLAVLGLCLAVCARST